MSALTKMELYFKKDFMQYTGRSALYVCIDKSVCFVYIKFYSCKT